jgi:MinD-like ATPase involved in chromosome partitioning or flagellar assembly
LKSVAFFNHKGGVGKTRMLVNITAETRRMSKMVLLVDLDAQANLTAIARQDHKLEELYAPIANGATAAPAFAPIVSGSGDMLLPEAIEIRGERVWLLPGNIKLSRFGELLPSSWTEELAGNVDGFGSRARIIGCRPKSTVASMRITRSWSGLNRAPCATRDTIMSYALIADPE